ncbi:MAG TPA: FadR/GntR family transcriptional regulator [Alphaproteobacteria bacterium]|nr:FadR/GntR family transcriptional regulator [Alphaproteobacteria bacterium]
MSDQFSTRGAPPDEAAGDGAGAPVRPVPWLRPVRTQSRDTAVLEAMTEYVASAGIRPGERLPPERDLALRLGVSRSTIREALKRWQGLGIVEMRKGSGTYLRTPVEPGSVHLPLTIAARAESLLLTLQVRRGLECEAAAVAARQATDDAIRDIEAKLLAVEEMHRRFGGAGQQDWEFHLAIYRATGNPLFEQIISQMHDAFHALFENPLKMPGFASRSFPLHREMFEAIRARDPDGAWRKAKAIIDITEEDVREAMRAR